MALIASHWIIRLLSNDVKVSNYPRISNLAKFSLITDGLRISASKSPCVVCLKYHAAMLIWYIVQCKHTQSDDTLRSGGP